MHNTEERTLVLTPNQRNRIKNLRADQERVARELSELTQRVQSLQREQIALEGKLSGILTAMADQFGFDLQKRVEVSPDFTHITGTFLQPEPAPEHEEKNTDCSEE